LANDNELKQALVKAHNIPGYDFFITATLTPSASRKAVEDALYEWISRVNRYYLGRSWKRSPHLQMQGVAFFETRNGHHAHLIVRPPVRASALHFALNAREWFYNARPYIRPPINKPVTKKGKMTVDWLKTEQDRVNAINYAAKHLEWRFNEGDWKYIGQMSARQLV
jgi:hypothetical protein